MEKPAFTLTEYARWFGISVQALGKWQLDKIGRKYTLESFAREMVANMSTKEDRLNLAQEQAKLAIARTKDVITSEKLKAIELKRKKGELVPAKDVQKTWEKFIISCKRRLLAIPSMAGQLFSLQDAKQIKDALDVAITEALEELSNG